MVLYLIYITLQTHINDTYVFFDGDLFKNTINEIKKPIILKLKSTIYVHMYSLVKK